MLQLPGLSPVRPARTGCGRRCLQLGALRSEADEYCWALPTCSEKGHEAYRTAVCPPKEKGVVNNTLKEYKIRRSASGSVLGRSNVLGMSD